MRPPRAKLAPAYSRSNPACPFCSDNPRAREALRQCLPDLLRNPQVRPSAVVPVLLCSLGGALVLATAPNCCRKRLLECLSARNFESRMLPPAPPHLACPPPAPAAVHGLPEGRRDDAALAGAAAGERGAPAGRSRTGHGRCGAHATGVRWLVLLRSKPASTCAPNLPRPAHWMTALRSSCCGCPPI